MAKVWDASTGKCKLTLRGHTNSITSVAFTNDGKRIVTAGQDGQTIIWDAENGTKLHVFKEEEMDNSFSSAHFHHLGRRLLTCSGSRVSV